jgi:hypothetical protein
MMIQRTDGSPKNAAMGAERASEIAVKPTPRASAAPPEPGHLIFREAALLDERCGEACLADHLREADKQHGHPDETVIRRTQEASHDQRGGPGDELGQPPHAPRPSDSLHEGAVEAAIAGGHAPP